MSHHGKSRSLVALLAVQILAISAPAFAISGPISGPRLAIERLGVDAPVTLVKAHPATGPVHGSGSSHSPIIKKPPVHGPGSSHNPIVSKPPVHGPGSSHDPIVVR